MLDIVQRALPHDGFVVVFGDTTMELKTTYQALSEAKAHWPSLEWYEARAEFEAEESWRRIGFPARKLRWCCSVHKTAPSIVKLKEIYKTKYPEAQRPFKVMVFDGVRAEESDARSTYTMISDGNKHAVQFNCSPILEWSSCELFLYIFKYGLLFNNRVLTTKQKTYVEARKALIEKLNIVKVPYALLKELRPELITIVDQFSLIKDNAQFNKAETASTIANLADDFVEFFNNQYEV